MPDDATLPAVAGGEEVVDSGPAHHDTLEGYRQTRKEAIQDLMRDGRSSYWKGPASGRLQQEYRDLVSAEETGTIPAVSRSTRKEQIQVLMRDPRGPYWRGSRAEALQSEYRALLEASSEGGEETQDAHVASAVRDLPAHGPERGQAMARAIIADLPQGDLPALMSESVDVLTEGLRSKMEAVLSRPSPAYWPEVGSAEIANFMRTEAGRQLVKEWHGANSYATGRAVGLIRAITEQFVSTLDDDEFEEFAHWLDTATPEEFCSICRILVK